MPDAREEVLREFDEAPGEALHWGNQYDTNAMADEIVRLREQARLREIDCANAEADNATLRAARDAAQREREEAERLLAQSVANTSSAMEAARLAIAQRDAAQAALQMSTALIRDLASQRIKGEEAQRRLDTIIDAALPDGAQEGG